MFATKALEFVKKVQPKTILDVGAGSCEQSKWMLDNTSAKVCAIDLVDPPTWKHERFTYKKGLFSDNFPVGGKSYDCVFISHVLEHQLNPNSFLREVLSALRENGWLVITFPPAKPQIVGGHVSIWNAGLLMYHLILAGQDCSMAKICQYGYNITLVVKRKPAIIQIRELKFDNGDIETLSPYFPAGANYQGFNGNILNLNWEDDEAAIRIPGAHK